MGGVFGLVFGFLGFWFTYFEVLFVEKIGTLCNEGLGYNTVPLGIECLLDETALVLADLPEINLEIGVGGGLVLGGEAHPLDVVHLEQKLCYLWF